MNKPITHGPAPFTAAGPYKVLDADRNDIASFSGPHKAGNQALFAAAPQMLAVLRDCLAYFEEAEREYDIDERGESGLIPLVFGAQKCRDAIAKTQEAGKS